MAESSARWSDWRARGILAVVLALAVDATSAQIPCGYQVLILQGPSCPPLNIPPPTTATGVNDLGDVVGHYSQCGAASGNDAYLWTRETGMTTLDRLPGVLSATSADVNDTLQIAGTMGGIVTPFRAYLYDQGQWLDLGVLPGAHWSGAGALTEQGKVVGWSSNIRTGPQEAFRWEDGPMVALDLPLGPNSGAADIYEANDQIVGWMGANTFDRRAFLWEGGQVTDLGVIPGGFTGSATAINSAGQITIGGQFNSDHPRAFISGGFLWKDVQWTDLGMLPGYDSMAVTGLNDSATVAGWCRAIESSNAPDAGFVWHDGAMINLNDLISCDLGLQIQRAEAINNAGQIVGRALDSEGIVVAFVLTPSENPPGDLDGDCQVGIIDFLELLSHWGPCEGCPADLDGDGIVGILDFLSLLANWG